MCVAEGGLSYTQKLKNLHYSKSMAIVKPVKKSKKVGELKSRFLSALNIRNCRCRTVYLSPGAEKHIKSKHPGEYKKNLSNIKQIVFKPDYIGINPKIGNSIELVKTFKVDILLAIKINKYGYLYISSMYSIGKNKVPKRLKSGRLIKAP